MVVLRVVIEVVAFVVVSFVPVVTVVSVCLFAATDTNRFGAA